MRAIRFARESGIPLLGTCGGFQHLVIEYARNVLGFQDAEHAEYNPDASRLMISKLPCSLVDQILPIAISPGSLAASLYGAARVESAITAILRSTRSMRRYSSRAICGLSAATMWVTFVSWS